jgi:hypothetical protein
LISHVTNSVAIRIVEELETRQSWLIVLCGRFFNTTKLRAKVNGSVTRDKASEVAIFGVLARFSIILNCNSLHCLALQVGKDHIRQVHFSLHRGNMPTIERRIIIDYNVAVCNFEGTAIDFDSATLNNSAEQQQDLSITGSQQCKLCCSL